MSDIRAPEAPDQYAGFAPYYDLGMNAALAQRTQEILLAHGLIEIDRADARSLVDLGTGTGEILASFVGKMDDLAGVDISPEMLAIAREKVPEAEFTEADIADFELGKEFDVALCLFDTLNHMRDIDRVEAAFERTAHHLTEGGLFIFDVITPGFTRRAAAKEHPDVWPIRGGKYRLKVVPVEGNDYTVDYSVELNGTDDAPARTIAGSIGETAYPIDEIRAAAGAHLEHVIDFDSHRIGGDGTVLAATDDSIRPVFVYQKQ